VGTKDPALVYPAQHASNITPNEEREKKRRFAVGRVLQLKIMTEERRETENYSDSAPYLRDSARSGS